MKIIRRLSAIIFIIIALFITVIPMVIIYGIYYIITGNDYIGYFFVGLFDVFDKIAGN